MAWFFPDGRIEQAMLSRPVTIEGRPFAAGDVVRFTHDGRLDLTPPRLDWMGPRANYP